MKELPKQEDYVFVVKRPYPPLFLTIIYQGMMDPVYYQGLYDDPSAVRMRHTIKIEGEIYYRKDELHSDAQLAWDQLMNPEGLQRIINELHKREQTLLNAYQNDFPTFAEKYKRFSPAVNIVWSPDHYGIFDAELRKALQGKVSEDELDRLVNTLNIPMENNYYKQEEYDLVKTDNLKSHVKKYEWLRARYGSRQAYTIDEARNRKESIDKEEYLKKYEDEKKDVERAISKVKTLLGADSHIVDVMQYVVFYRTQRTDVLNWVQYEYIPKLDELAGKLGITYEQLLHCTPEEVTRNRIPSKDILDQRIKSHVLYMEDGKTVEVLIGKDEKKIKQAFRQSFENVTEIKGTIACKGLVKGQAKVIKSSKDYGKIEKGDILVTSMTTPDMLPIMYKSAAFVTDEGGITCHAAIVSRELNKPCIIGTGHATKVLRDGRMVEVDADKGIIKILE